MLLYVLFKFYTPFLLQQSGFYLKHLLLMLGLMYFKPPSNLQDNFMPYFEVNLHFFLTINYCASIIYTILEPF